MFRSLRLVDAFEHLVSPAQWEWFGPMVARHVLHIGRDGWPLFPVEQLHAYPRVWEEAAKSALTKLQGGEWVAEGISPRFGPHRIRIDTDLWDYLRIKDRVEEAEGGGFLFIALTVSEVKEPHVEVSHSAQAGLRSQLTKWLRDHAERSESAPLRSEQLDAARSAFEGRVITDNMFRECRRAAALPARSVQRGRPKAKGLDE
ncbi:MAG: hypothetical protein EON58_04380 [Alphaproteobacteria bacterium]|nr:MAG: hypothetical protein EON58_04380 [Alphaproteobacteria bacterium]